MKSWKRMWLISVMVSLSPWVNPPVQAQDFKKVVDLIVVIEDGLKSMIAEDSSRRKAEIAAIRAEVNELRALLEDNSKGASTAENALKNVIAQSQAGFVPASPQPGSGWNVKVDGFVDFYYTHNFQRPSTRLNHLRSFDIYENQFSLNLAKLGFVQKPNPIGLTLELTIGPTADVVHTIDGTVDETFKYVQQAYASVVLPFWKGATIDLGKFVTHLGAEVIETNANWNYSRSLLFTWAIPFFHTGLRVSVPLSENLTVMGMVANGWNRILDNNSSKTFGAQVGWSPIEGLTLVQNWISGPEQENDHTRVRTVWDAVVSLEASDRLAFNLNYDYGYESVEGGSTSWTGVSLMARYALRNDLAVAVRGEWFHDREGWQTGVAQELKELTATGEWRAQERILLRAEFRRDWSNTEVFDGRSGAATQRAQNTVILGDIFDF